MGFTVENWQQHAAVSGRVAVEEDVRANRATFYVPDSSHADVFEMDCPYPAMLTDEDGNRIALLILHTQYALDRKVVVAGAIDPKGKHYVTTLADLEVTGMPSAEWTNAVEAAQ